ncbi:MAG: hypothetical protein M1323_02635 [Candidatus Thermoplasmatota archaeon]|nr:hypothetical protein [Candidatus Thermoplasmatota archaeon]
MNTEFYLILISITLAVLHMIAPDHWIPISILSAKRRYTDGKTATYGLFIGITHGILSTILALLVAFLGISIIGYDRIKIGSIVLLVLVCLYILLNIRKEVHETEKIENTSLLVSFIPDPAFLPIVLAATVFGGFFIGMISALFIVSGGISLMIISLFAKKGMLKGLEKIKPTNVDYIIVVVLAFTAFFIYFT